MFQPLNEKAAAVVTQRIDLLESGGGCVEPCLLQLVAHVSAYRVLLERWRLGDVSATSAISYPDTLLGYVQATFASIKRRQVSASQP